MEPEKNEFEDLANDFADEPPQPGISKGNESLISARRPGEIYDINTAPEGTRAPPRQPLDGHEVIIVDSKIILPGEDKPWLKTRKGDKDYKACTFELTYSEKGMKEFFSGIRCFKRDDGKYSHPTITRDRVNQASELLGLYSDYKKKDINEVSLKEFLGYLASKPKVLIKTVEIMNPTTKEKIKKNLVAKFI